MSGSVREPGLDLGAKGRAQLAMNCDKCGVHPAEEWDPHEPRVAYFVEGLLEMYEHENSIPCVNLRVKI